MIILLVFSLLLLVSVNTQQNLTAEECRRWKNIFGNETVKDLYSITNDVDKKNIMPGGREGYVQVLRDDKIWIYGGEGYTVKSEIDTIIRLADIWSFDLLTKLWTLEKGPTVLHRERIISHPTDYHINNFPCGRKQTAHLIDHNGNLLIFGGKAKGYFSASQTMWSFRFSDKSWKLIRDHPYDLQVLECGNNGTLGSINYTVYGEPLNYHEDNIPPPHYNGKFLKIKVGNNESFLFYGSTILSNKYYGSNEVWEYDTVLEQFRFRKGPDNKCYDNEGNIPAQQKTYLESNFPPGRYRPIIWVLNTTLYTYGGRNMDYIEEDYCNDMWAYDYLKNMWSFVFGVNPPEQRNPKIDYKFMFYPTNTPGGMRNTFGWKFDTEEYLYFYGGYYATAYLNSIIWAYSPISHQWMFVNGTHEVDRKGELFFPGTRHSHGGVVWRNKFILFLGVSKNGYYHDIWQYDPQKCYNNGVFNNDTETCDCDEYYEKNFTNWVWEDEVCLNGYNNVTDCEGSDCEEQEEQDLIIELFSLLLNFLSIYWGWLLLAFIIFIILIVVVLFLLSFFQMRGKLNKLKDVDILLQEQEVAEKTEPKFKINQKMFEINYTDIKLEKEIAKGGSECTIYKAVWKSNDVAFKVFRVKSSLSEQRDFDVFEKEITMLASLSHPNILIFYGCTLKNDRVGIVMEYCSNGSVHDYLLMNPKFSIPDRFKILNQVVLAMEFLHEKKIIHRDLKSANVLLDDRIIAKVIDFGLSRVFESNPDTNMTKRIGTSTYMAPEISSGKEYTGKIDVFSFGIVFYEILTGDMEPYKKIMEKRKSSASVELLVAVDPNFRPIVPKKFEIFKESIELMKKCWDHEPDVRPSFSEIRTKLEEIKKTVNEKKINESQEEEKNQETET